MTDIQPDAWTIEKSPLLSDVVAERIYASILSGLLKPGERIVEASLAQKFGVSRGPLREALKTLHAARVIQGRKGESMRIVEPSVQQVAQMLLLRATLEGLAARLVAAFRTPSSLRPLVTLHRASVAAAKAGRLAEWRDLDWQFHEAVCRAAENEYLFASWRTIGNLVRLFLSHHPGFEGDGAGVLGNHDRLITVLKSGTPDAAEALFRGSILASGYARLGLEIPPHLREIARAAEVGGMEEASA